MKIVHRYFIVETLYRENQQTKDLYHSSIRKTLLTMIEDHNSLGLQTNNFSSPLNLLYIIMHI